MNKKNEINNLTDNMGTKVLIFLSTRIQVSKYKYKISCPLFWTFSSIKFTYIVESKVRCYAMLCMFSELRFYCFSKAPYHQLILLRCNFHSSLSKSADKYQILIRKTSYNVQNYWIIQK